MNQIRLRKDWQQSVSLSPDSFREVFVRRVLFVLFLALLFLWHPWTNQAQNRPAKWLEEDFLKIHMELNVPNRVGRSVGERFDKDEYLLHLVYAPVQKGMPGLMPQVWKLAPIHDVELTVRCPRPGKVLLEPQGRELEFTHDGSAVHVKVPEVHIYEIVRIIAAK